MTEHKLPIRPKPYDGESAGSILIRTAELNGYVNVYQLLSGVGFRSHQLSLRALLSDSRRFSELASKLGLGADSADLVLPRKGKTRMSPVLIENMVTPISLIRDDVTLFCPHCLADAGYWRNRWLVRPWAACDIHGCLLLERCLECGEAPQVGRGKLCECGTCQKPLTSMPTVRVDAASMRQLSSMLEGHTPSDLALSFWQAMSEFDGGAVSVKDDYRRTHAMAAFLEAPHDIAHWLASHVSASPSRTHPRIQLVPFLVRGGPVARLGLKALSHIDAAISEHATEVPKGGLSKREACAALGMSPVQLQTLIRKGLLTWPAADGRQHKVPIVEVDRYIRQSENVSGCEKQTMPAPTVIRESHEWADVVAVAARLDVHPDIVRSLLHARWLTGFKCKIGGIRKIVVSLDDLRNFEKDFVLVGTLAKQWGVNPTNLCEKLQSLGVHPVGGRRIDKVMTSLFRRDALTNIGPAEVVEIDTYPTRTGRKPNAYRPDPLSSRALRVRFVADLLNVTSRQVGGLIRRGVLVEADPGKAPVLVTRSSLTRLQKLLASPCWMPIREAADLLGSTQAMFSRTWVNSGIVEVKDLGPWRLASKADVEKAQTLREDYLTPAEASKLVGMHRCHMSNLERRGAVKGTRIGVGYGLRLYKREAVINL